MRNTPRERSIEKSFVKPAKALGCMVHKIDPRFSAGWPDRLVLIPGGRIIFIEFKRPGEDLSPIQDAVHSDMVKIGHRKNLFVFDNWQGALDLVKSLMR